MRIVLADLGHNQVTLSSDIFSLGVANLAAFPQKYIVSPESINYEIVREPQELRALIDDSEIDVLGVSSYGNPASFETEVKKETHAKITSRVETFGEHPAELGKFTRTMFAQNLPRSVSNNLNAEGIDMGVTV